MQTPIPSKKQDLAPDSTLMSFIYEDENYRVGKILLQSIWRCVFVAHPIDSVGQDHVVRLGLAEEKNVFEKTSILQRIAHQVLPELVPLVDRFGAAKLANGVDVVYSVMRYIGDTVTLEEIWNDLSQEQQLKFFKSVSVAVSKISVCSLAQVDAQERKILAGEGVSDGALIGTIPLGFHATAAGFFGKVVADHQKRGREISTMKEESDGTLVFHSQDNHWPDVVLSSEDIADIMANCVLCHNDLEPRNILVHRSNETSDIELAAIIDWEMAGFVPFTYDSTNKDYLLGCCNLYPSWYELYKKEFALALEPRYQKKLSEVLHLLWITMEKTTGVSVGTLAARKWREQTKMSLLQPPGSGWTVEGGEFPKKIDTEEFDRLIQEIVSSRSK